MHAPPGVEAVGVLLAALLRADVERPGLLRQRRVDQRRRVRRGLGGVVRGVAVARAEADLAGLRAGAVEGAAGVRALGVRGALRAADRAALGPPQAGLAVAAGAVALIAAVLAVPVAVDAGARRGGGATALELGQLVVLAVARRGDEERACADTDSGMSVGSRTVGETAPMKKNRGATAAASAPSDTDSGMRAGVKSRELR